jgi:hypothetical protein
VRGVPTAYAAPPMKGHLVESKEPIPVWPDPQGETRGYLFSPLHKFAPQSAKEDEKLYELLVLVDSIRSGSVRENRIAINELKNRLERYDYKE